MSTQQMNINEKTNINGEFRTIDIQNWKKVKLDKEEKSGQ